MPTTSQTFVLDAGESVGTKIIVSVLLETREGQRHSQIITQIFKN